MDDPPKTCSELVRVVVQLNQEAGAECLRQGANQDGLQLLSRAKELLDAADESFVDPSLTGARAMTLTNLGVLHKREKSFPEAVLQLERAIKLYTGMGSDLRSLAAAHLNLAECYMDAGLPRRALRNSMMTVDVVGRLIVDEEGRAAKECAHEGGAKSSADKSGDFSMLAIAYHKTAEAHEALRQWGKAVIAYTQAYEVAKWCHGPDHELTKSFEKSMWCPHRRNPPVVPRTWRTTRVRQRSPFLPRTTDRMVPDASEYHPKHHFPEWPPRNASKEELEWYRMAENHQRRERQQALARIRAAEYAEASRGAPAHTCS